MDLADALLGVIIARGRLLDRPILVGLAGPQGSGKSTLAGRLAVGLRAAGLVPGVLSLDDFYLPRARRQVLAAEIHPLLATRGPPGTHDLALLEAAVDSALAGKPVAVPRFDKALDDRAPVSRELSAPTDTVLLEGWCIGASPERDEDLLRPVNALERDEDPDCVWRRFVNTSLAAYQPLFSRLDLLIQLRSPDFGTVARWRGEQEAGLRAERRGDPGAKVMDEAGIARFIQHYERITRRMLQQPRADVLVDLDTSRRVVALRAFD